MPIPRAEVAPADPTTKRRVKRPEIQALRAFAVAAVVINHLAPRSIPGGYIGVDVFFVISGYLIAAHLLRELERTGGIALGAFWARRARRLLPASLLVLAVTAVATWLWAPKLEWQGFFAGIGTAAGYVVNWFLAAESVDYLAGERSPSPVQHYWSLSVEEQFYIVWPLLILAAAALAVRFGRNRRTGVAVVMWAVAIASFVTCVVWTLLDPIPAYFVTPVRAWEFAAGAIIAVSFDKVRMRGALSGAVSLVAWAALLATLVVFTPDIEFPGAYALVPVLATAAIILSGPSLPSWLDRAASVRPVQWLGDISYSLYLWHWPLIVFVPLALGHDVGLGWALAIALVSLVLADLTKRLIEDPFRTAPRVVDAPLGAQYAAVAASMAVLIAVSAVSWSWVQSQIERAEQQLQSVSEAPPPCIGASVLDPAADCGSPENEDIYPDRIAGQSDAPLPKGEKCRQTAGKATVITCTLVEGERDGLRVALVGDSHAEHWAPALTEIAEARGWELTTYLKGGCPFADARREADTVTARESCREWNARVMTKLAEQEPDVVVTSQMSGRDYLPTDGLSSHDTAVAGLTRTWKTVEKEIGAKVIAIRDSPVMGRNVPGCLERLGDELWDRIDSCGRAQKKVLRDDPQVDAAKKTGVTLVDLTRYFCREDECPAVIGQVIVYRDSSHLGGLYSRTLAPYLGEAIDKALAAAKR